MGSGEAAAFPVLENHSQECYVLCGGDRHSLGSEESQRRHKEEQRNRLQNEHGVLYNTGHHPRDSRGAMESGRILQTSRLGF